MILIRQTSAAVVLVTLTLSLQRRHGCGDCMGKTQVCARSSQARGDQFRHPRDAMDDCVHWLAPFGDSALGGLLSLALFYIVGICLLLLGCQLCDRWLRRCRSSVDLADLGSSGKHHWRADVRVVGELPVRRREQASRP
jgi:hypothetical protein